MPKCVAVSEATAREANALIVGCETCDTKAQMPLCWLLDAVTWASPPGRTDYVLLEPLECPQCGARITESTLVEWT